ncbi:WD40 repeat domain-containing protein [Actinoallomurus vinaceus]
MPGHTDLVWSAAWSPDGRKIVTGSEDGTARIWNTTARGAEIAMLEVVTGETDSRRGTAALSPDGTTIAIGSWDGDLLVQCIDQRDLSPALSGHEKDINAVAWSPGGESVATASDDRTIRVWNPSDRSHQVIARCSKEVEALAWSPDGRRLAVGSKDAMVRILDLEDANRSTELAGHADWVGCLAWSPSGRLLASGSADHTVRVWSPFSGRDSAVIGVHSGSVGTLNWLPDGNRVISASADRTIRIWAVDLSDHDLLRIANTRVTRRLTIGERRAHLLPEQTVITSGDER